MSRKGITVALLFFIFAAVALSSVAISSSPAFSEPRTAADGYPAKNIDIVIPTEEGGAMDRAVRAFVSVWRTYLKTNFQTSFYPGASGEVGYRFFMEKPADGYTLLAGNIGPEVLMYAMQKPNYTFPGDYTYFGTMDADPVVIWVNKNSPFNTIQDLIEEGKKRTVTFATSRYPHPATLAVLLLAQETGADFNIVSYGGGAPTRTAAITGEVDAATTHLSSSSDLGSEIKFLVMFNDKNYWKEISNNAPTATEALKKEFPSLGANRAWAVKNEFISKFPERYKLLLETFDATMKDPRLAEELKKVGMNPEFVSQLDEKGSMALAGDMLKLADTYKDLLKGKK
jgi:tripartite-type tricarboxylate transporter receptor subunit TctC